MYGGQRNPGDDMAERITDNWIQQNVPGGLNSQLGQQLDNMMGGNPNPTMGQAYGSGGPRFGGANNMGGGFPGQFGGGPPGQFGGGPPGGFGGGPPGAFGGGSPGPFGGEHHHHHHHHHHDDHHHHHDDHHHHHH